MSKVEALLVVIILAGLAILAKSSWEIVYGLGGLVDNNYNIPCNKINMPDKERGDT